MVGNDASSIVGEQRVKFRRDSESFAPVLVELRSRDSRDDSCWRDGNEPGEISHRLAIPSPLQTRLAEAKNNEAKSPRLYAAH